LLREDDFDATGWDRLFDHLPSIIPNEECHSRPSVLHNQIELPPEHVT